MARISPPRQPRDENAPTPERQAKGDLEPWTHGDIRRAVTTQIDWLHVRGHIDPRQKEAGEKLFSDWYRSGLHTERAAEIRERVDYRADPEASVECLNHRSAFTQALQDVGLELSGLMCDVVIHDVPLAECRSIHGYTGARARQVETLTLLRLALNRLARYYGIVPPRPRLVAERGVPSAEALAAIVSSKHTP